MPFTFKLSQRLARMRCTALLLSTAAFAACERPTEVTDPGTTAVSRLVVSPKILTLRQNQLTDFMAVGLTSAGDTADVAVSWSVTSGAITDTSTSSGRHYGRYKAGSDTGKVKVVATGRPGGASDTAVVTVTPLPVAGVSVSPASASVTVGQTVQLSATTKDSAGGVLSGRTVSWTSSNASVATVSSGGLVTGAATGSATITATSEGQSGTASITVTNVPVASVAVTPASATIQVGQTAQLTATPKDASGNSLAGRPVTWASSNTSVATVSGSGLVTGIAAGSAIVTATSEGQSGTASITVAAAPAPTGECTAPQSGWIWCDDFEQDRLSRYFEYDNAGGAFVRAAAVGLGGSVGMRVGFAAGQVSAGALHLAFGKTPQSYFRPVDAGTAVYREIYWRMYVRNQPGWTGGGADKLSRAMSFASTTTWAQAMIAHVWSGSSPNQDYLLVDPASGTDAAGNLQTTTYNDFANMRWLGAARGATPIFDGSHVGQWHCVEAHVRLNDAGQSNGTFDLWVNGAIEAQRTGLNWVGAFNAYGINAIFFENYWNAGAVQPEERYFDNIVVSTQPIGCVGSGPPPPPPPPPPPAPVASVTVAPGSASVGLGGTQQFAATLRDANGNVLSGRTVTWSSSNPAVATVSASGVATALVAGTATITATSEGRNGTAALTVTAPAPGGSWPHEPAGWTALAEHSGDVLTPAGWSQIWNNYGYESVAVDASAPFSPAGVLQYRWPAGWTNQVGMGALVHGLPGVRRAFVGIWWKPSNPWQGHVSNTNKIQYLFTNGSGSIFMAMYGPPGGPFEIVVFPQFSTSRDRWLVPNVNRVNVTLGQWHRIEWLVDYSGPQGRIQWWLDGVLLGDYSDDPSPPEGFSEYKLHPVWGGAEAIPKTQTDYYWYDHVHITGR